jgi:hypothetical protein
MSDTNEAQANMNAEPEKNPGAEKSKVRIIVGSGNNFAGARIRFGTIADGDIVTDISLIVDPSSEQNTGDI